MRKKNKLYTVNKFNKPLFIPEENLFPTGGPMPVQMTGLSANGNGMWNTNDTNVFFGMNTGLSGNAMQGLQAYNQQLAAQNQAQYLRNQGNYEMDNPFSLKESFGKGAVKAGLKAGAGAAISAGAGLVGGLAGNAISGGLSSGAGSAISGIGSTLGSAVGSVNPVLGAAISVGSGILGGVTNALFGSSVDEKKLNAAKEGTAAYNNFVSNASSFDDIQGPTAQANVEDAYKGGLFTSGSARKKNEELKRQRIAARQFADRSITNNVNNLASDQMNNALANYSAFGGPLDMGAINYDFMTDYLISKNKKADNNSQMTNLFAGTPGTMFAIGGDLQTHGSDFSDGLVTIGAGGSHEENPYDGVQLGQDENLVPNLVEEGETVYDDYVFSNRIMADSTTKELFKLPKKKDITFADISKKLEKEISERPADPISEAGFKSMVLKLEEQQERQKQEMEAERAKAAFEALSPEEQTAVMQQRAEQEAMAQQAAEEEAVAEQQAMQQPSPEEMQMMQQQQAMQADGSQAMISQEPQMNAYGGKINKFDKGGDIKKKIYELLGIDTDEKFQEWASKHGNREFIGRMKDVNWEKALEDMELMEAVAGDNKALRDALSKGYDFGLFKPENNGKATIQSISRGNWKTTNGKGWRGSQDLAFKQATEDLTDEQIDALTTEQLAERMRNTEAYKNTNKWLENADNALLYLNTLYNDPDTPQVAKDYAAKFIKDGKWKEGFNYDYATVFGSNGKGVRETNPGTYWHTAMEANRGSQAQNLLWNPQTNEWNVIQGNVNPAYQKSGSYSWTSPDTDYIYNYYTDPSAVVVAPEGAKIPEEKVVEEEEKNYVPKLRDERLRYAGLFGPAVGLGLMAAGVGKPDTASLEAAARGAGNVHLADYQPIGDYLRYNPMDIWFEQNRMDANARATDRAIMNSGSNQGSKAAALLASGLNSQIASGELYRKALEYNDAQREKVAAFNRGTNQFNAEAYNRNSQFNADAKNRATQAASSLALQAAREKLDADAGWYNSLYGNIGGLFEGLANLGTENARHNMLAKMAADGVFGNTGKSYTGSTYTKEASEGGKVKKKKNKRGLTF